MSDSIVTPNATRPLRMSRMVLVTCVAASSLLIAWTAVVLGHAEPTEEALLIVPARPHSVAQPSAASGAGTGVPSASEVFSGRETPPEEPVPTF